jgi:hypothetical protein
MAIAGKQPMIELCTDFCTVAPNAIASPDQTDIL